MAVVSMKTLLETGVHFGHRTRRWNPKMKPYIFTERNGIHILDLQQTIVLIEEAYNLVRDIVARGQDVWFVGTKRQAQDTVAYEASRANQPFVNQRWLGGTLVNWQTIRQRIDYLKRLEARRTAGEFDLLKKRERLTVENEIAKLNERLGGIRTARGLPGALFVIDVNHEETAVKEANTLKIPVVALVDTNCNPDPIDYIIPSNDDAIRAIKLICGKMADAALEGLASRKDVAVEEEFVELGSYNYKRFDDMEEISDELLLGESILAKIRVTDDFTGDKDDDTEERAKKTHYIVSPSFISQPPKIRVTDIFAEDKDNDTEEEAKETRYIVSTGFTSQPQPDVPFKPTFPLTVGQNYFFWFEVGKKVVDSIEEKDMELPIGNSLSKVELDIVLFGFEDGLELISGQTVGQLQVTLEGQVKVVKPVTLPPGLLGNELVKRRLFFPVRTPSAPGTYRLRCHVYFKNTLVQSRVVTVQVMVKSLVQETNAITSIVDYTLSETLTDHQLQGIGQTRLSILINQSGDGTHGFRFFGRQETERPFQYTATLSDGIVRSLISNARSALHRATWGDPKPYQPGKPCRYKNSLDLNQLREDLIRLAIWGYRFYDRLISQLSGNGFRQLQELMRQPGQLQVALKEFASIVPPVALFYDHPFNDNRRLSDYTLCPTFVQSLEEKVSLEETPCFQGICPNYGRKTIICPSGFWGFRHFLGAPVTVYPGYDAPVTIPISDIPCLAVGVCTDPEFRERESHISRLKSLKVGWEYAETLEQTIEMLRTTRAQVVYFYCHGGMSDGMPYLVVGPPGEDWFTRSLLRAEDISWATQHPLVFINGCYTAALEPEQAFDLVTGFVGTAKAVGVIGTETTIFESVAVSFAESFFQRFFLQSQTVGEAVRGSRLDMLQGGNPLGLVYIPYVLPGLRLAKEQVN